MTIRTIIDDKGSDVVTIDGDASVRSALALLSDRRIGALCVMHGEELAGILSERDVVTCLNADGGDILDWPCDRLMTTPARTVGPESGIDEALGLMTRRRIRHLPVVESGRIAGIVSIGDLVKVKIADAQQEADAMREYIQAV